MLQRIGTGEVDAVPGEGQVVRADGRILEMAHQHLDGVGGAAVTQLEEGDVIQPEIVAAGIGVLVDDGDGGLRVVAAVPHHIKMEPGVGGPVRGRGGEDTPDLLAVDAELQLGPRTVGHSGDPGGEGVVGVRGDGDGLRPDDRAGRGGPVDNHIVAVAGSVVGAPLEIGVVGAGIAPHIVGALTPQVGVLGVAAREPRTALLEIAVADEVDARVVAGHDHVHRLAGRADGLAGGGGGEVRRRGPDIVVSARGREQHALPLVQDGVARRENGGRRIDGQVKRDDAVASRGVG